MFLLSMIFFFFDKVFIITNRSIDPPPPTIIFNHLDIYVILFVIRGWLSHRRLTRRPHLSPLLCCSVRRRFASVSQFSVDYRSRAKIARRKLIFLDSVSILLFSFIIRLVIIHPITFVRIHWQSPRLIFSET